MYIQRPNAQALKLGLFYRISNLGNQGLYTSTKDPAWVRGCRISLSHIFFLKRTTDFMLDRFIGIKFLRKNYSCMKN